MKTKIYNCIILLAFLVTLQLIPLYEEALQANNQLTYARNQSTENSNKRYTTDETIYRLLRKYPSAPNYSTVSSIISCESNWDSDAKNRQSTASGYFQFTYNTWYFEALKRLGWSNLISPFEGERNLEGGIFLLSEGEDWRWQSSKHCWNK